MCQLAPLLSVCRCTVNDLYYRVGYLVRYFPKLPEPDHSVTKNRFRHNIVCPGADHTGVLGSGKNSLTVGRRDWCHPGGCRPAFPHARWVVSCSPSPCYCYSNAVFVSVCEGWSQQSCVLSRSFSLTFNSHLSYLIWPFKLNHSLFISESYIGLTHQFPPSSADGTTSTTPISHCVPSFPSFSPLPLFSWTSNLLYTFFCKPLLNSK